MRPIPTPIPGRLQRPDPVVYAIGALLGAAALVLYLQYRDLKALKAQTEVVLQKVAEQTAAAAATEIRRTFEGPVFDTLTTVNHPLLRDGRFDLVVQQYEEGLAKYPQVERFFLWHSLTEAIAPGEVLFFGGSQADGNAAGGPGSVLLPGGPADSGVVGFHRDPPFGRLVFETAREQAKSQWIYAAVEARVGDALYDVFVRLFWTDAKRDHFFAVLGFVVNHDHVRGRLFAELYRRKLASLLDQKNGGFRLELRVLDAARQTVFGPGGAPPPATGRAPFALAFYPADEIRSRMAAGVPDRRWEVAVSPDTEGAHAGAVATGYWLSGIAVLLMLVALGLALQGRKRAAELSGMQADFVSHVSHQLKTPLSLLSAVSETLDLERVRSPEKLAQYLQIMRSETARLSVLVDRILEFSRVQNRGRSYELEAVDVTQLVRESAEAFERAWTRDGVTIEIQEIGPPPIVAADPAALEQVLVNLLDNAVRYSYGSKAVTVRVGQVGSDAIVEVQDRGIGIAPEDRERIFEKFYRGSGAALHSQGFGLGLAIVRELVAAHRGRIEVDSETERGSTFRIRLPLTVRKDRPVGVDVPARDRLGRLAVPSGRTSSAEARRGG